MTRRERQLDCKPLDGHYDYIIVGAGSAGCVLANRLSAERNCNVLLIEAGGNDNWIWFHIPVGYLFAINNPRSDWMYQTTPQPGLNGRALIYPRGKTLGGSSAINAMIAMRGQPSDYDNWREAGLPGWGWDDIKDIFSDVEDHFLADHSDLGECHGKGGEWRIEAPRIRWPILDAVQIAAKQMQIPESKDFHASNKECSGYFQVNQHKGLRWSSAKGFLKPVRHRSNLRVLTRAQTHSLILKNGKVEGVRFSHEGQNFYATARRQTILSAGAIGSVEILQRSGIGPANILQDAGTPVSFNCPGVGQNLQDHLQQRAIYKISGATTLNETHHNLTSRIKMGVDFALRRRGPMTMAPSQLGIFMKSQKSVQAPDLQFHVQPLSLDKFGDPLHKFPAITVSACNLRPTSRGFVALSSPDHYEKPLISPNYLSTDEDKKVAANAIRATRHLMAQPALSPFSPLEYLPGLNVADDDASLIKAAGDIGTTIFHPVGTNKMGPDHDPMAVVDERLRFRGLKGLSIIDASVMPTITSGNTNTPTIMIAEKGARMLIEDQN